MTTQPCRSRLLVASVDEGRLDPIAFTGGRVLWSPRRAGLFDVLGCLWRGGRRCTTARVTEPAPVAVSRRLLDFDGRTLLLSTGALGRLEICRPILEGRSCTPQRVTIDGESSLSVEAASIGGSLLAFELFPFPGSLLGYCQLDLETADCRNPRLVETLGSVRGPDVSGRRIVWSEEIEGEPSSIASCEWDPLTGECPRTRLTGATAPASAAKIDQHRVVWQDGRIGPDQIFGLELPRLWLPRQVEIRSGGRRFIPVSAPDPAGGLLGLELVAHSGPSPETLGAEIIPLGHGWAGIVIQAPSMSGAQSAVWQLRGEGRGGLMTRETLEISVLAKPRSHGQRGRRSRSKN